MIGSGKTGPNRFHLNSLPKALVKPANIDSNLHEYNNYQHK